MNHLLLYRNNFYDNFLNEVERHFDYDNRSSVYPRLDIVENENDYQLSFEVPGFSEDQIKIEVKDGLLTVKGEIETQSETKKDEEKVDKPAQYRLRERSHHSFERTFRLPQDVNPEQINAQLKNGELNLKLDKKEEEKPRLIKIN